MGFFKNHIAGTSKEEAVGNDPSVRFADEMRQIQENYEQGFLSEEQYVFQTGLYKKWSNTSMPNRQFHVVEKGTFDNEVLFSISGEVSQFISDLFTINDELHPDFYWLKPVASRPCFHHLCFTFRKTVYSCLIGVVMEGGEIWVGPQDADNFFRETLGNCLYPCIIPVTQSGELYDEGSPILDAMTLLPIDFDKEEEFIPSYMTEYELYARALEEVITSLVERGCSGFCACDIMNITPSLFFVDENGQQSYLIIRSVPAGADGWTYQFNKSLVEYYKDEKGYFVNLLWNNLLWNDGNFRDVRIYKNGSYVHNKIEFEPLDNMEAFAHHHPHFDYVSKNLHGIQVNSHPIGQDDVWESSLEEISEKEKIRYRICKRYEELKPGETFDLECVFGRDGVSADEYSEFLNVTARLSHLVPVFDTPEELQDAESSVREDDDIVMCRIANTHVAKGDYDEAVKWYSAAADLGNSDAMCRMGGAYKYGAGVEQSMDKAILFYKKAIATDGNADALLDLGLCYLQGEGVAIDYDRGFFLMERSAKQGNMAAQYNMGVLYRTGKGVDANMEEALRWYRLSAAQGYGQAVDFLSQYAKESPS